MSARLHALELLCDTDQARALNGAGNPAAGLLVVQIPHRLTSRQDARLARLVNDAFGARHDVLVGNTSARMEWLWARARALALGIDTVIITSAEWLPPKLVRELQGWAEGLDLDLWLVGHAGLTSLPDHTRRRSPSDLTALLDRPTRDRCPETTASLPHGLQLPRVEFLLLRSECRRLLNPEVFAQVDSIWRDAYEQGLPLRSHANDEAVAEHLTQLAENSPSLLHFEIALAATQAVLFTHGHVIRRLNRDDLLARVADKGLRNNHDWATYVRLHAFRQPWRAAAVVLYGLGLTVEQLRYLACGDVDLERWTVSVGDARITIPEPARTLVATQAAVRGQFEAKPSEPFLVWDSDFERLTEAAITSTLQAARTDTGFPIHHGLLDTTTTRPVVPPHIVNVERVSDVHLEPAITGDPPSPPTSQPSRPAGPHATLDGELIRRRRQELMISREDLAADLRVRGSVIRRLESGEGGDDLNVGQLVTLAERLAVDVQELLLDPDLRAVAQDAAQLGALLHGAVTLVPRELACETLDWDLQRVDAAAQALDHALEPAGLRVNASRGMLAIVARARAITSEQTQHLLRHHRPRRSLSIADARYLHANLAGDRHYRSKPGVKQQAEARLRNAGLIDRDGVPTPEVRWSLGL